MSLLTRAQALSEEFIGIRRQIHQNPELGFSEFETTRLITEKLQSFGVETRPNGDSTGVIGLLRGAKPGKVIGLRADIDALKMSEGTGLPYASQKEGVCHSCGHDLHTATLLCAAKLLSEYREELCGTVKFIFQPAEETMGGSRNMIQNGVMENPKMDYILGAHTWPEMPAGSIGVRKGTMLGAADKFKITITGKGGHAAHPHKCVDPVVVGAYLITQLQTIISREVAPVDPAVITIGKLAAGTVSNVIPNEAVLEGTVRTVNPKTRLYIKDAVERMAKNVAEGMKASAKVDYEVGGPMTISDDSVVDAVSAAVAGLLGADHLLEVPVASMGAEDFAEYLQFIPGGFFRLGTYDERPETKFALHSPKILFNEQCVVSGAVTMCGAVFKLTGSNFEALK